MRDWEGGGQTRGMAERRYVWDLMKEVDGYVASEIWIKSSKLFSPLFILADGTREDLIPLVKDKVDSYLREIEGDRKKVMSIQVHPSMVELFWPFLVEHISHVFEPSRDGFRDKYKEHMESAVEGPHTLVVTRYLLSNVEIVEDGGEDALMSIGVVVIPKETCVGYGDEVALGRILRVLRKDVDIRSEWLHRALFDGLPPWVTSLSTQETSRPYYVEFARWIKEKERNFVIVVTSKGGSPTGLVWLGGVSVVTDLDAARLWGTRHRGRNYRLETLKCKNCRRYDAKGVHYLSNARGYICPAFDREEREAYRGVYRRLCSRRPRGIWSLVRRRR